MASQGLRREVSSRIPAVLLLWLVMAGFALAGGPTFVGTAHALGPGCTKLPDGRIDCSGHDEPGPGGPDNPGPAPRQPYDVFMTPACMQNGPPPSPGDAMCLGATTACQGRGEPGMIMMRIYYQWNAGDPWTLVDTRCTGGDTPQVPPQRVRDELVTRFLPAADVGVSPGNGRTLIDFDTIFYTEAAPYHQNIQIIGQQVEVDAQPVGYAWKWGDGSGDHTSTAGVPYSASTDESAYVMHRYASPGTYTVNVDVNWTARFRVAGGPWQNLGTLTVARGQTAPITALEKEDVLSR